MLRLGQRPLAIGVGQSAPLEIWAPRLTDSMLIIGQPAAGMQMRARSKAKRTVRGELVQFAAGALGKGSGA